MSALGYGLGDYTLNGGPIHADRRVAHQTLPISRLDSRAPCVSSRLHPDPLSSHSPRLGVSALRRMVRRMSGAVPDGLRISFRFGGSSDASATAKRLARQLPHR